MVKILEMNLKDQQMQKALTFMERFHQNGDEERVEKAKKLIKKIHDNEFITAFSGHFSAGKSTMINSLIGEQILPSSPIPTSANLVKVHHAANDYAKVYYNLEKPLLFQAPYDFNTLKDFCKNGDVSIIEIGKKDSELPDGVTIMDTPGVDSTDDAHRISTESALHLADIVFYVMDYNHVQSELNFMYTKNLLTHGVNLYLIINQIDKHNDDELSFQEFKTSVYESFASWDVNPAGIFFTTLKDPHHLENEFNTIKFMIEDAFLHRSEWMEVTIEAAIKRLEVEHNTWLDEELKMEAEPFEQVIAGYSESELSQVFLKEQSLLESREQILSSVNRWERDFEKDRDLLLKNAYLMPFETRELAEQYVVAARPDFKVGFLFNKKKTEEERQARLTKFAESVQKQVEAQLDWHIRQMASTQLAKTDIYREELLSAAQKLTVDFEKRLLSETVKSGAGTTGEYILNYCADVADELKKIALRETNLFKTLVSNAMEEETSIKIVTILNELKTIGKVADALRSINNLEKVYEEKSRLIDFSIKNDIELQHLVKEWLEEKEDVRIYSDDIELQLITSETENEEATESEAEHHEPILMDKMIRKLEATISYLSGDKVFNRISAQLAQKSARLKERNYTISLFGAFSAGKSSFANALIGENILPVSPNPTTAAINRICPPNAVNKHGTAVVRLKKAEDLLEDILQSLQLFGYECTSLDEAYTLIPRVLSQKEGEGKEKVHLSFLSAFHEGYGSFGNQLGDSLNTNLKEFANFVAIESKSCFVEAIDLYYDCSFTREGITLVDTPGADSINARHTNVAFDYIKNSDAILFVTYYNHAFSKADREFLIQLGRVKDAFELDKMFFIVNAIDLASSEEEIAEVLDYVKSQLAGNGIRFPRIFGISSKLAQFKDSRAQSNIESFNREFTNFLKRDLAKLTVQSAEVEFNRAKMMLDQLIESASQDESEKEARIKQLDENRSRIMAMMSETELGTLSDRLYQEVKELAFYVKQRVFYRFSDFFKEAFNPSQLQNNSRSQLRKSLDELLEATGYDFAQEMRATSLRLEKYTEKLLHERFHTFEKELQSIQADLTLSNFEYIKSETPNFEHAFAHVERKGLESSFKYFKNPKAFFEQNEKKVMEEALQDMLSPLADEYLIREVANLNHHYQESANLAFSQMIAGITIDIEEQYHAWLHALSDAGSLSEWIRIRRALGV